MKQTYAEKRLHLRVPVGATPVPRYATWDEHRAAISRDAAESRARHGVGPRQAS